MIKTNADQLAQFFCSEIDCGVEDFNFAINKLADDYRVNVIIPICKSYGLTYRNPASVLNYLLEFNKPGKFSIYSKLDALKAGLVYLLDIYTVLHHRVLALEFGMYIKPVLEADYKD